MLRDPTSIRDLQAAFSASADPSAEIMNTTLAALARANNNASANSYLWRDETWTIAEARKAVNIHEMERSSPIGTLVGVPVSVKDCFDLAGAPTSCGTTFYRDLNSFASKDSWLVDKLRKAGAVITGKTHLHPLAYGITGENPEFGDCLQPGNPNVLTGGSSSGAAATILEGSALAAIGTDTGGSIRVPAAVCGIAGYRASLGRGDWTGAAHLAPSFDTFGWLFRDLEDGPLLASFFAPPHLGKARSPNQFAFVGNDFLHDCEPIVFATYQKAKQELEEIGITGTMIDVDWWLDSIEIFTSIQASEAAAIHGGHFAHFEPSIQKRLEWGATIGNVELQQLRARHQAFRVRMDDLLARYELLVLPATPVASLPARADHSDIRLRLLRYTTPASLSGMPAVTVPFLSGGKPSGAVQIIAAREHDEPLLQFAANIAKFCKISTAS